MIPKECKFDPEYSVLEEAEYAWGDCETGKIPQANSLRWLQMVVLKFVDQNQTRIRWIIYSVLFVAYTIYFAFAVRYDMKGAMALIVVTSVAAAGIVYAWIRDHFGDKIYSAMCVPVIGLWDKHWPVIRWFAYPACIAAVVIYLFVDVIDNIRQLQSLLGMVLFFLVPWVTSKYPSQIKWRPVLWGMMLQFLIGCLVLRWPFGYKVVEFLANEFSKFLAYSIRGGAKVFGDPTFIIHPFAMVVVPLVIYLGCIMAILYYWGVIQWVAKKLGWLMSISLQTTSIESVSLVVNIFLSVVDVILMLKKYIHLLTPSEFHCFLVAAHSTIAGFAFGLFVLFGVEPQHLLTGAVMSAPAAVAFSKLNFPETEQSFFTVDSDLDLSQGDDMTTMGAAVRGGWEAGMSVATILIQTLAFLAMFFFLDASFTWFFALVGFETDIASFLGYIFMPFAFLMGVDWEDTFKVGRLIGLKVTANEFLGFFELGGLSAAGEISPRSAAIATYAMCGFSSFGTMVIFAGVWNTIDPARTVLVLKQLPRMMMNCNLSCFMTACLASILYSEEVAVVDTSRNAFSTLLQLIVNYNDGFEDIQEKAKLVVNYEQ